MADIENVIVVVYHTPNPQPPYIPVLVPYVTHLVCSGHPTLDNFL